MFYDVRLIKNNVVHTVFLTAHFSAKASDYCKFLFATVANQGKDSGNDQADGEGNIGVKV